MSSPRQDTQVLLQVCGQDRRRGKEDRGMHRQQNDHVLNKYMYFGIANLSSVPVKSLDSVFFTFIIFYIVD